MEIAGMDHNQLANRTKGDPHPMYGRKDSHGAGGTLPSGAAIGDMMYWDGTEWLPTSKVSFTPDTLSATCRVSVFVNDGEAFTVYNLTSDDLFQVDATNSVCYFRNGVVLVQSKLQVEAGFSIAFFTPSSYPHTITSGQYAIAVNTSSARTINLPASPLQGDQYEIGDNTGNCSGVNKITISGNGHNIMAAATLDLTTAWSSITLRYNGSIWRPV